MAIIKWDPFGEMKNFFDDEFFSMKNTGAFTPKLDIFRKDDQLVVKAALPKIDSKDVDISIENDVLTIQGQTRKESEVDEKNYYRKEVSEGSFYRTVSLPAHVIADKAHAEYK